MCCQGYHGILCGACDNTHGKTKSGSCMDCSPRGVHIAMAFFSSLWTIAIIVIVLKRALSYGESGGTAHKDDQAISSCPIAQADEGSYSNNILKDIKGQSENIEDVPGSVKKGHHSKHSTDIVRSSETVASSQTRKSYISEIGKVGDTT